MLATKKGFCSSALFSPFANQRPTLAWPSALISTQETGQDHDTIRRVSRFVPQEEEIKVFNRGLVSVLRNAKDCVVTF